jgi:hypothetical protein
MVLHRDRCPLPTNRCWWGLPSEAGVLMQVSNDFSALHQKFRFSDACWELPSEAGTLMQVPSDFSALPEISGYSVPHDFTDVHEISRYSMLVGIAI